MNNSIKDIRNNEETSRAGNKWTIEEDEQLKQEIIDNKSYDEISILHKRTITGIKSRVISIIIYPEYKKENIDELAAKYNIEKNLIEKYTYKFECANNNNPEKVDKIENKLIILEQKLDYIISILTKNI